MLELNHIYLGDCLEVLKTLPDNSIHCCVTSPPYYGLRDYGTTEWEGGDTLYQCTHCGAIQRIVCACTVCGGIITPIKCDHSAAKMKTRYDYAMDSSPVQNQKRTGTDAVGGMYKSICPTCGAKRIDKQVGLEQTPEEYVAKLVAIFREVRRVLRKDGTVWLNLGDSYASFKDAKCVPNTVSGGQKSMPTMGAVNRSAATFRNTGIKHKDLIGIPWMVAFALRADGWWLRQDIIWAKGLSGVASEHWAGAVMPESVTDRCTKAHEYIFLLTKSSKYFYDHEAVKESSVGQNRHDLTGGGYDPPGQACHTGTRTDAEALPEKSRNRRSVWTVTPSQFKGSHFATFPPGLVEVPIKAGTSEKGCCPKCGAPWVRVVDKTTSFEGGSGKAGRTAEEVNESGKWVGQQYGVNIKLGPVTSTSTVGWEPSCDCGLDPVPCVVLDPFMGAGTTGLVASRLGRKYVGIELNPEYAEMADKRIRADSAAYPREVNVIGINLDDDDSPFLDMFL